MNQAIKKGSKPSAKTKGYRSSATGSSKDNGVKRPSSPVMEAPWPGEEKAKIK